MYREDESGKFFQIATVRGAVGQCGDRDYPGIFVRVDHPSIWKFIYSTVKGNMNKTFFFPFWGKFFEFEIRQFVFKFEISSASII